MKMIYKNYPVDIYSKIKETFSMTDFSSIQKEDTSSGKSFLTNKQKVKFAGRVRHSLRGLANTTCFLKVIFGKYKAFSSANNQLRYSITIKYN